MAVCSYIYTDYISYVLSVPLLVNCSFPIADRSFWCYEHEWNVGAVSELECLRLLLDAGADPNAGSLPALQNVLRQRAPVSNNLDL
jgi:hypothetical protein